MATTRVCGKCGTPVSAYAPEGLCPTCILVGGLDVSGAMAAENGAPAPPSTTNVTSADFPRWRFGDYELLEEIAHGGMGVVYKARQISLNRIVAVKMILAGRLASAAEVQRFRAEAESAAQLQHPNIVSIHEVGESEGQPYFSMDYIEGTHLAALIREGPLPARRAAAYVRTIAAAIHYAHQHGVLHRDLKPSNVLIDSFDQPRVTDFGLAKRLQGDSDITLSGQALGSPSYMPPEQAASRHGAVGVHSDVYALGAILYHLLTGRPPFVANTAQEILLAVRDREPLAPCLLNPTAPRDLETICLKCLEKDPSQRYVSALALEEDLGRFLREEPILARPATFRERIVKWAKRKPAIAALVGGVVLAVVTGLSGIAWQWQKAEKARKRAEDNLRQARRTVEASLELVADPRLERFVFYTLRRDLLKQAIASYEQLRRQEPDGTGLEAGQAQLRLRLARIHWNLGDKSSALSNVGDAQGIFTRLSRLHPEVPDYRAGAASIPTSRGFYLKEMERWKEAEEALVEARALHEKLAAEFPTNATCLSGLSTTLLLLGELFREAGRLAEAEGPLRQALGIAEKLERVFPSDGAYRNLLVRIRGQLSLVLRDTGRSTEAERELREAARSGEKLVKDFAGIADYRVWLAGTWDKLGRLLSLNGRPQEAEAYCRRAVAVREELAGDFGEMPECRFGLAQSRRLLAMVLRGSDQKKQAEEEFRQALVIYEKLAFESPEMREYQHWVAVTCRNLAELHRIEERFKDAETNLHRALEVSERLLHDFPSSPVYARERADCRVSEGALFLQTRRPEEAKARLQSAVGIYEKLTVELPTVVEYQSELGSALQTLGEVLTEKGELTEAQDLLRRAIQWQSSVVKTDPKRQDFCAKLSSHYKYFTAILVRAGEHEQAAAAATQWIGVMPEDGKAHQRAAAVLAECIGLVEKDQRLGADQRKSAAESYATQAVEVLRRASQKGLLQVDNLDQDPALSRLRSRGAFQRLRELEKVVK